MTPKPVEYVYECGQCFELLVIPPGDMAHYRAQGLVDGEHVYCSRKCKERAEESASYNADQARLT